MSEGRHDETVAACADASAAASTARSSPVFKAWLLSAALLLSHLAEIQASDSFFIDLPAHDPWRAVVPPPAPSSAVAVIDPPAAPALAPAPAAAAPGGSLVTPVLRSGTEARRRRAKRLPKKRRVKDHRKWVKAMSRAAVSDRHRRRHLLQGLDGLPTAGAGEETYLQEQQQQQPAGDTYGSGGGEGSPASWIDALLQLPLFSQMRRGSDVDAGTPATGAPRPPSAPVVRAPSAAARSAPGVDASLRISFASTGALGAAVRLPAPPRAMAVQVVRASDGAVETILGGLPYGQQVVEMRVAGGERYTVEIRDEGEGAGYGGSVCSAVPRVGSGLVCRA